MSYKIGSSTILVLIYNRVILFPPTFNAILLLSDIMKKVIVLEVTDTIDTSIHFPSNVEICSIRKKAGSYLDKIETFRAFLSKYNSLVKEFQPDIVLFYDSMCAMTVYFAKGMFASNRVYWYHNHDVIQREYLKTFSLLRISYFFEKKIMRHLHIFSLPSNERKEYFKLTHFRGDYHFIPNYPSVKIYNEEKLARYNENQLKIIFQGNINVGHGIEELIELLPLSINSKTVKIGLIGFVFGDYRKVIQKVIDDRNLSEFVAFLEPVPYPQLARITCQYDIGIAIYTKKDAMNSTLGTASNKIYEYTASGLPFLYFDTPHFRKHLERMPWAIKTDLSKSSLVSALTHIDNHYNELSSQARQEFLKQYNYEAVFTTVVESIPTIDVFQPRTHTTSLL